MAKKKTAKSKSHSRSRSGALPEDTIELHLPQALYARIAALKDPDQKDLLKVLFHCPHKDASVFGVNKVNLVQAARRKDDDDDDSDPYKICTGP